VNVIFASASIVFTFFLWYAVTRWGNLPEFILPSPGIVWERFITSVQSGTLQIHTTSTFSEVIGGLLIGISIAALLGYLLAKSRTAERLLAPFIVASQSIPIVAIAPLLIIWFGSGRLSKVLISAMIVFFPILVNTIVAVRSVPEDLRDLMRSLQATRWQVFSKLELPAAMPVLLGGLKIGATLSVIGAVVGEFVAADEGLGFLINLARGMYDTAMVFVAVFTLIGMALMLYSIVAILEVHFLYWREDAARK
jgi:NitT/TauT family transport system permease protein